MTNKHTAIPFIDLHAQQRAIRPLIDKAIQKVLDHGRYGFGPECEILEKALSDFSGVRHVLGCSNGTDALTMLLIDLGVGKGDAVFVPSYTYIATAEVVALRGATPVFVDVDMDTFNMDAQDLKKAIKDAQKEGLHLKGVISVDLFGQPADHNKIAAVADEHKLWVINDAAQSFGATYQGQSTVQYCYAATTSFFPAKPLGGYGDGGAIFVHDDALNKRLKSIRVHGHGRNPLEIDNLGLTGRLDTIQAAVLIEKLKIFPAEIEQRQKSADLYNAAFEHVLDVPKVAEGSTSVWAQYTVRLKHERQRDGLQEHLTDIGIPTAIYYKRPLHTQHVYRKRSFDRTLKNTEQLAKTVLSLPMHGYLRPDVQGQIIEGVSGYFKK